MNCMCYRNKPTPHYPLEEIPINCQYFVMNQRLKEHLEDEYGIVPKETDGQVHLSVENKNAATRAVSKMLSSWSSESEKLKSGEITKEEYDMWRYSYPRIKAERIHEEFKKLKNNTEK